MGTKLLTSLSLAAVVAFPLGASASSKNETLTISLTVNPIILLFLTESDLTMSATDLTSAQLDGRGQSVSDGRAEFYVAANTGYDILLSADETWGDPGDKKVKFVEANDNSLYLAGELFLDTDISSDTRTAGDTDIIAWNKLAGFVMHSSPDRGLHRYGVGAIFDPTDWSGAAADALPGAPEEAVSIAPSGTYSSVATITVVSR